LTLMIDPQGLVEDVSTGQDMLASLGCLNWVGKPWVDTVTTESKSKILDLLQAKPDAPQLLWRHVNHPTPSGEEAAIQYITLALPTGKLVAVGRSLHRLTELQKRLVETQQSVERDYLRLRHIEARYRILFETAPEAILMVDANAYRVLENNAGAQALVKDAGKRFVGKDFRDLFEAESRSEVEFLLRTALATGRIEICAVKLMGSAALLTLSVCVFRQEGGAQFLARLTPRESQPLNGADWASSTVLGEAMRQFPDGWILTDTAGAVQSVNEEGMALLGLTSSSQILGQSLERWLLRGAVDWGVLITSLKQQIPVRNFATEVRTQSGMTLPVEVSAVNLSRPEPLYAFFVRDMDRRHPAPSYATPSAQPGYNELSQLVGRKPIKDIVGETVDNVERICIETALELTHNNRASAAEMLGLSRQSLYVKLRRFGILSDPESDPPLS